jgi:ribosome-associated heat shock protein Hsp15
VSGKVTEQVEEGGLETVRADLWLWAVRLYKTRNLATGACRKGQVRIQGNAIKPGRNLRVGDELQVQRGYLTAHYRVRAVPCQRVGAKLVDFFLEDLTTAEEREKAKQLAEQNRLVPAQSGAKGRRPTKKERRQMEELAGLDQSPVEPQELEEIWKKAIRL